MEFRREKGRNASYYRHPMGDDVGDILVRHEMTRNDRVADMVQYHSSPSHIFTIYGGVEEYISAMQKIYGRKQLSDVSIWNKDRLISKSVFQTLTADIKRALRLNYNKLVSRNELLYDWTPVFWWPNPSRPVDVQDFFRRLYEAIGLEGISTYDMCMFSGERPCDTRIYMRKSFLEKSEWGQNKINFFRCLNRKYIIEHKL